MGAVSVHRPSCCVQYKRKGMRSIKSRPLLSCLSPCRSAPTRIRPTAPHRAPNASKLRHNRMLRLRLSRYTKKKLLIL